MVETRSIPVVGMGSSAGGLDALGHFFDHMPSDAGIAFVIVAHQHPDYPSLMVELLSKHTEMPVVQIEDHMVLQPDRIHVSPPGRLVLIEGAQLRVREAADDQRLTLPIDFFFRSLAAERRERAIGIVLSGTGTDGTNGLREIKGVSGMIMVQSEESARYSGMPHSAISTALVDYVLPAEKCPSHLLAYIRSPYFGRDHHTDADLQGAQVASLAASGEQKRPSLKPILSLLLRHVGHDFSSYKESTISRRVDRRMNVHHLGSTDDYARFLREHPSELDSLFRELLIGVTSFFRDREAFEALARLLDGLVEQKGDGQNLRVWIPGCSSGEEAYSIAILVRECLERKGRVLDVQIFATDIDSAQVEQARTGVYPESIAADVDRGRLDRFFSREEGRFRVRKEVREMIVFAPQDVLEDPPFTRVDLIACRNLLIYFGADAQRRVIYLFHYALRRQGLLFLGPSESLGALSDLFEVVDKRWKVFVRKDVPAGRYVPEFSAGPLADPQADGATVPEGGKRRGDLATLVNRVLINQLVPPSVLVSSRGDIVHIHGRTGRYLEPFPGLQAHANVFSMARPGLEVDLGVLIRQAAATGEAVEHRNVRVQSNGGHTLVRLAAHRIDEPEELRGLVLVSFEGEREIEPLVPPSDATVEAQGRISELERALQHAREGYQGLIEELETANEELKSTNEELQSTNEELQSTNEELETSKEEMQSLNEELQTVNSELQGKIEELSRANDDMQNLLNSTDIAVLFLDRNLCIKRFTRQATKIFNLISTDIGRPISDLVAKLHYDELASDARMVLTTLVFREREVRGSDSTWYYVRILPYRTAENVIDGLVLTFVDISKVRSLEASESGLLAALSGAPFLALGQDHELKITWAYAPPLGTDGQRIVGKTDLDLWAPAEAEPVMLLKRKVLATGQGIREQVKLTVAGRATIQDLHIEPVRGESGVVEGLSAVAIDITEWKVAEGKAAALSDELKELRRMLSVKGDPS